MEELTRIMTSSAIVIQRLALLLNENNITTRIQNNGDSGRLAGFGTQNNDVDLFVQSSDFESAQKVLEENN